MTHRNHSYNQDNDSKLWYPAKGDAEGYQYSKGMVKDPDTLAWVPATQSVIKTDTLAVTASVTFPATQPISCKTGDATYQVPRLDFATHSIINIDYVHHEIHDGHAYMYHDVIDSLASGVVQDYLITTANSAAWLHISHDVEFAGAGTVEIFEGGDRVGTTAQTLYNRDRNNLTAATSTIHKGTSGGTVDGTRIVYWKGGATQSKNSATHGTASEKILKPNTKYILRVTSRAEANIVSVSIGWYEHANKAA
jgi:hypothetical protein